MEHSGKKLLFSKPSPELKRQREKMSFCAKETTTRCQAMVQHGHILLSGRWPQAKLLRKKNMISPNNYLQHNIRTHLSPEPLHSPQR